MKILIILLLLSSIANAEVKISLADVSKKVKGQNYTLLENAQKVYQSKEMINFSRKNLLPKFNFWNLIKIPFDPAASIDLIQDVAPFLVPSNWFKIQENKIFADVYNQQYNALWANEVLTAKLLYMSAAKDNEFLELLKHQMVQVDELIAIAKTREIFAGQSPQSRKFLQIKRLEINEDIRSLSQLLMIEKKELVGILGLEAQEEIILDSIELPSRETTKPIDPIPMLDNALKASPEIKQFKLLRSALKYVRKEVYFSFLGGSSYSGGIGGGVFDNIPMQGGLGFGAGPSLRIAKSEGKSLEIRENATAEVIKRNLIVLAKTQNSVVENLDNHNERLALSMQNFRIIKTQFLLGEEISALEMLESLNNLFDAAISQKNFLYDLAQIEEKINRLILAKDYGDAANKF